MLLMDFLENELHKNPEWRQLLSAYCHAQTAARTADGESDGWVDRIPSLDGVSESHLPRIHGKLIALGLLGFQLTGRATSVVYRVSPAGRDLLEGRSPESAAASTA